MTIDELVKKAAECIRRAHQGEDMVERADKELAELEGPMVAAGYLPEQIVRMAYDTLYPPTSDVLAATA